MNPSFRISNNIGTVRLKKAITLYIMVGVMLFSATIQAQEANDAWTLEQCIRHALEHNIDLHQRQQTEAARRIDLNTGRHSWLPNLNAGLGQNLDFGRSPSKTGVIVDMNSANSTFSLQLSMPLFDGLRMPNDIAARRLDLLAATENLHKAQEDVSVTVASLFVQALYNKEMVAIAEAQLALCAEQVAKTSQLVEAGKVPASQLYDIKAQQARDDVSLTEARNNLSLALLDLSQSLETDNNGFDITAPDTSDPILRYMSSIQPPEHIYEQAVAVKPQIREQQFVLESQHHRLRMAQSGYLPQLNLSAGYSNGYYRYYGGEATANISLADQLNQNERKTIGLSLSIPIFNRFQVRNSVRSARVAIRNNELVLDATRKALYKEIQQAWHNAIAAQQSYIAAGKSLEAAAEAYRYAEERYHAGRIGAYEYSEAKTLHTRSLAEQTQAKYNYIFRAKLLDFYRGVPLQLH